MTVSPSPYSQVSFASRGAANSARTRARRALEAAGAAELFVGADEHAHAALQPHAFLAQRLEGEEGADRRALIISDAAAVNETVFDLALPGVAAPAVGGGNDVDVGEDGDHLGQALVAELGDAHLVLEGPGAEAHPFADLQELLERGFRPWTERSAALGRSVDAGHGDELADRADQCVFVRGDAGANVFHVHVKLLLRIECCVLGGVLSVCRPVSPFARGRDRLCRFRRLSARHVSLPPERARRTSPSRCPES